MRTCDVVLCDQRGVMGRIGFLTRRSRGRLQTEEGTAAEIRARGSEFHISAGTIRKETCVDDELDFARSQRAIAAMTCRKAFRIRC